MAQRGNVGGKGATAWVLGRGRPGKAEGVGKGGDGPRAGGGQGNNGAFGDCAGSFPPPPASQRVPSVGWIRVAAWGQGRGHEWALVLALGVGQAPRAHYALARPGQLPWPPRSWLNAGALGKQAPP